MVKLSYVRGRLYERWINLNSGSSPPLPLGGRGGGSGGEDPEFRLEVDRAIHRIVDFQLPHEEWLKKQ